MPEDRDDRALLAVLHRSYESKDLDYKGPMLWDEANKVACCELVKDILGMANMLGGFIVIGVAECPTGFSWEGLTPEQLRSFETSRLNRFLQNYAEPPVNALLRKIEDGGKQFVIIEVPQFPDTPHLCVKDFPKVLSAPTLYIRTDNNETAPVRSSADFRLVVERAVRNRSDALLTSMRAILTTGMVPQQSASVADGFLQQRADAVAAFEELNPLKGDACAGFFEASLLPTRFEAQRFTLEQVREAATRASVDFRGWPFLFIHPNRPDCTYVISDGLQTFVTAEDSLGDDMVDFWRLQQSGFFYQRTAIRPSAMPSDEASPQSRSGARGESRVTCVVDFRAIAIYIAEGIHCLSRLYDGLLDDGDEVSFLYRLLGARGRVLVRGGPYAGRLSADYVCRIPEIALERRRSLAEWRAGMVEHSLELAAEVYQRFNWPNPNLAAARSAVEKMFARRM